MSKYILLVLLALALTLIFLGVVSGEADAEGDVTNEVYLPMVANNTPEEQFIIDRTDCPYVFLKWVNPSLGIDKSYTAGLLSVDKLGGGDLGFSTIHWWYDQGDIVWYWTSYDFDVWGRYYLDAYVKVPGGYVWVSNGDQLWYPCPPH